MNFEYSIDIAKAIYTSIKNNEEAISICKSNIYLFFKKKGEDFNTRIDNDELSDITYYSEVQSISLKDHMIILSKDDKYTNEIIQIAHKEKALFGLPVFTIATIEDLPITIITLMDYSTFQSLNNPEIQEFMRQMNMLSEFGDF